MMNNYAKIKFMVKNSDAKGEHNDFINTAVVINALV